MEGVQSPTDTRDSSYKTAETTRAPQKITPNTGKSTTITENILKPDTGESKKILGHVFIVFKSTTHLLM